MSQVSNVPSASNAIVATLPRVPRAGGLCAQVWDICHAAAKKGAPIQSKEISGICATLGLNLNNFKIERSCYNRFVAGGGQYGAPAVVAQEPLSMSDVLLSNMLAARPAPVLPVATEITPEVPQVAAEVPQVAAGKGKGKGKGSKKH
jgi:hypothetical protein